MMRTADLAAARQEDDVACRIECVQDVSGFAALQPCWNDLLHASAADNPFLTFEWLYPWWKHLGGDADLQLLAVWSRERLIAVAPLMTRRSFGWLPRMEFLGTGHAGSDYLDLIVRSGHEADALNSISECLADEGMSLRLDHVLERSATATLADRLRAVGWTSTMVSNGVCPVIDLAQHTWTSYLASRGSAHRANVRRRLKTAEELLRPTFERVTTECQRREALLALFDFHESRFRERGGSTAFLTSALRAFHDEATERLLESGGLRMYMLRVDGAVAAVMYGFGHNDQFFFYQHGFDNRYQRSSIGLVLMAYTIRAAFEEGIHTYDLLWGAEPYKWLWATSARTLYRLDLFPAHLGGWLHKNAVEARRRLAPLTRRALMLGASRAV